MTRAGWWMVGLMAMGCDTVFAEDFDEMALGEPGDAEVGRLTTSGDVTVVDTPVAECGDSIASQWVRIAAPPESELRARITSARWSGRLTAGLQLCLAEGAGDFQLAMWGQRGALMHTLDLTSAGRLVLEDGTDIGAFEHGAAIGMLATVDNGGVTWTITGDDIIQERWEADHDLLTVDGFQELQLAFAEGASGEAFADGMAISVHTEE